MTAEQRRKQRNRRRLIASAYPRLCVKRSLRHIYAQVIDDGRRHTLAAASSKDKGLGAAQSGSVECAKLVGQAIAERALQAGVKKVVFDRGAYLYHGRVKALAEGARANGLEF